MAIPESTLTRLRAGIYDLSGLVPRERTRVAAMVRERRREDEMGFPEACRAVAKVLEQEPPADLDAILDPEDDPWTSTAERFWT